MTEGLIHIFRAILGLIFPQKCLGCGIQGGFLCDKCRVSLPECFETGFNNPKIFSATLYENDIVKKAIRRFKYHGVKSLAEPLGQLVFRRLKMKDAGLKDIGYPSGAIIIPIPLSRKRLRRRGYNQSELMGKFLSDKLSVNMRTDVLYKIKETISQVEIKDRNKRLENLRGAFEVKNPDAIKNKTVILIDDIVTTGATMKEASRVLKNAGAKNVIGLVVAKGG